MNQEQQSYDALQIAFQTMKERCQQLQSRLSIVEKENEFLRRQNIKKDSIDEVKKFDQTVREDSNTIQTEQIKVNELMEQKSQLLFHINMVSYENQRLWKRLSKVTSASESLGHHFIKTSDMLNQSPSNEIFYSTCGSSDISEVLKANALDIELGQIEIEKNHSIEKTSFNLINNFLIENPKLKKQYSRFIKLQSIQDDNLGFIYAEDIGESSIEHLKCHDAKLARIKDTLLSQQKKLYNTLRNLKDIKKKKFFKNNKEKIMCQTGTQFDLGNSLEEKTKTQNNFVTLKETIEDVVEIPDNTDDNIYPYICPLCGVTYEKLLSFDLFNEHVMSHVTKDVPDNF